VGVIVTDDTEFATLPVYDVVDAPKVGLSEPALGTSPLKSASVLHARSTVTVYVLVVAPSCAVTTTDSTTDPPSATEKLDDCTPDVIATLFTFPIDAPLCCVVAVSATDDTEFATDTVYEYDELENVGDRVPESSARADSDDS
jgi:hypothetical protein